MTVWAAFLLLIPAAAAGLSFRTPGGGVSGEMTDQVWLVQITGPARKKILRFHQGADYLRDYGDRPAIDTVTIIKSSVPAQRPYAADPELFERFGLITVMNQKVAAFRLRQALYTTIELGYVGPARDLYVIRSEAGRPVSGRGETLSSKRHKELLQAFLNKLTLAPEPPGAAAAAPEEEALAAQAPHNRRWPNRPPRSKAVVGTAVDFNNGEIVAAIGSSIQTVAVRDRAVQDKRAPEWFLYSTPAPSAPLPRVYITRYSAPSFAAADFPPDLDRWMPLTTVKIGETRVPLYSGSRRSRLYLALYHHPETEANIPFIYYSFEFFAQAPTHAALRLIQEFFDQASITPPGRRSKPQPGTEPAGAVPEAPHPARPTVDQRPTSPQGSDAHEILR